MSEENLKPFGGTPFGLLRYTPTPYTNSRKFLMVSDLSSSHAFSMVAAFSLAATSRSGTSRARIRLEIFVRTSGIVRSTCKKYSGLASDSGSSLRLVTSCFNSISNDFSGKRLESATNVSKSRIDVLPEIIECFNVSTGTWNFFMTNSTTVQRVCCKYLGCAISGFVGVLTSASLLDPAAALLDCPNRPVDLGGALKTSSINDLSKSISFGFISIKTVPLPAAPRNIFQRQGTNALREGSCHV
mmetsp:Transcript_6259/g.9764  ORF Transcript_6259/g.9764 Transcript_6259/m.9764 type:complete len:243 (+) Transcript_6259:1059-1787(+)